MPVLLPAHPALAAALVPAGQGALAAMGTDPRAGLLVARHAFHVTAHGHGLLHGVLAWAARLVTLPGTRVVLRAFTLARFHAPVGKL